MKDFNFEKDLIIEFQSFAKLWGFRLSANKSFEDLLLDYLTVRLRIIDPQKREVRISPCLEAVLKSHPKRREIETISRSAGLGLNINHFQSKRVFQSNFHDHLQNEWNIYHFHLSLQRDKTSRFVKQVNSLLFAYVTDHQFILLGTDTHSKGIFGDTKWIEKLHDYFPEVISKYKSTTMQKIHPTFSSTERQSLWDAGYTLGNTNIREVVYKSPGLGRMASGRGFKVVKTADTVMDWLNTLKDQLLEFGTEICSLYNVIPSESEFKIISGEVTFELFEKKSRTSLLAFPFVFNISKNS